MNCALWTGSCISCSVSGSTHSCVWQGVLAGGKGQEASCRVQTLREGWRAGPGSRRWESQGSRPTGQMGPRKWGRGVGWDGLLLCVLAGDKPSWDQRLSTGFCPFLLLNAFAEELGSTARPLSHCRQTLRLVEPSCHALDVQTSPICCALLRGPNPHHNMQCRAAEGARLPRDRDCNWSCS